MPAIKRKVQGRYRIFILDEARQLTTQSQNALLKCIEEPPPHVVFILHTTKVHKLLPTIVNFTFGHCQFK